MFDSTPIVLAFLVLVATVRSTGEFEEPPAELSREEWSYNKRYYEGEMINATWNCNLESMNLTIWLDYPSTSETGEYQTLFTNEDYTTWPWKASFEGFYTFNKSSFPAVEDAVFNFAIYNATSKPDFTSHRFNVTINRTEKVSTTTTSSATATAATWDVTNATDSPTPSAQADTKGVSKGEVVGISVGVTLGGLLIFGIAGLLAWRHFRKRYSARQDTSQCTQSQPELPAEGSKSPEMAGPNLNQPPQEVSADSSAGPDPRAVYEMS